MVALAYVFVFVLSSTLVQGEQKLRMKLFTPGPAVTSATVKAALPDDIGIDEKYYLDKVEYIQKNLLEIGNLNKDKFVAVLMQGTGTYANEAAIRTATPKGGKVLILNNGFFGEELIKICQFSEINYKALSWNEGERMDLKEIEEHLRKNRRYATVAMVHFDTSTTMLNNLTEIGKLVKRYLPKAAFVVDAIGSYGCIPFNFEEAKVDFVTLAPHRCLQAFLGYAFVIARKKRLEASKDNCKSFVLSVYDQQYQLETSGIYRFTTAVQVVAATKQGVVEYLEEGMENRIKRYTENRDLVRKGLSDMGFVPLIKKEYGTSVVTAFYWPNHVFKWSDFQLRLEQKRTYLYATSLTKTEVFRVGHIGNITKSDCEEFLSDVKSVLKSMNVSVPFPRGRYRTKE